MILRRPIQLFFALTLTLDGTSEEMFGLSPSSAEQM